MTYREACRQALRDALIREPHAFLMGEDVGRYGGCFAVSTGLLDEFGPERIRDTPLSESAFVGGGIGAAIGGMRPIVEIMTVNFSLLALDQILNNAASFLHMSGGQCNVPLVIRMTTGGGRQVAAQHSHSLEGWYAHIPGLRILTPATIDDARGMLWPALLDPDPVLIFEHASLYNTSGEVGESAEPFDISRAAVRRRGNDVTLISYGGTLRVALEAAEVLASAGVEADVIDLRTLRPLDDRDVHRLRAPNASRGRRRRRLAQRLDLGRDRRENRRARVLRPRRTGGASVQRRGPDAVRQASRRRRAPNYWSSRRGRTAGDRRWLIRACSACRRSAPT